MLIQRQLLKTIRFSVPHVIFILQRTRLISKLINADYYSPFNLAVSKDGRRLYVVAQEANTLLVVDPENHKVLNKIRVGNLPHSVVLSSDEQKAYVSNQWSDNVSVIDLATSQGD